MAREARPEDVFVLFLGGHGKSIAGHYYYYPQTIEFSGAIPLSSMASGRTSGRLGSPG